MAQTNIALGRIQRDIAGLGKDDLARAALEERLAELTRLLDDLEHHVPSASVVAAAVQIRTRGTA